MYSLEPSQGLGSTYLLSNVLKSKVCTFSIFLSMSLPIAVLRTYSISGNILLLVTCSFNKPFNPGGLFWKAKGCCRLIARSASSNPAEGIMYNRSVCCVLCR